MERIVYFDNAATTPIRKEVIESMHEVLLNNFGNPSSTHSFGRSAKTQIETARKSIAKHFNAHPQEIIFTSGGTESDNMLVRCSVQDLGVETVITSKIEHHAILHAVEFLAANKLAQVLYVKTDEEGVVDYNDLAHLLAADNSKKLVSLMHINNEIGSILDLERVSNLCKTHNALFHSDAVQGVGQIRSINGHDVYVKHNQCEPCLRDLHRYLKNDSIIHPLTKLRLGGWQFLQQNLIPLLIFHKKDKKLSFMTVMMMV